MLLHPQIQQAGFLRVAKPDFLRTGLLYAQRVLYRSGLASVYVRLGLSRGATILMYHSVPDETTVPWVDPRNTMTPERFDAQMRFLSRRRNVISLTELAGMLTLGIDPAPGTVVITFDDGYLDTLKVAAPILERYGLPATLFLPTAYINRGENQWIDTAYCAFLYRTADVLTLDGLHFNLAIPDQAAAAFEDVVRRCIAALPSERTEILGALRTQLAPAQEAPRMTMNWDEVRMLRDRYPRFELGVHTAEHLDLTAHEERVIRADMTSAIADFGREMEEVPQHVAFPYNRSNEISQSVIQALGFQSALSTSANPLIRSDNNRYALPRIEAPASMSLFRFWTTSAWPTLSLALFGRA